ncbi:MT-A70 [Azospirillum lipoferum]|nr:MT-A70 [Azospirillum lipoferum]
MRDNIAADFCENLSSERFGAVLVNSPWNILYEELRHKGLAAEADKYQEALMGALLALPVERLLDERCHLYLYTPNSAIPSGLELLKRWGFDYKSNLIIHNGKGAAQSGGQKSKFFRNVTDMVLFGVRGKGARTLDPGRTQVNYFEAPCQLHRVIEACSSGPYLELFNDQARPGWTAWKWQFLEHA